MRLRTTGPQTTGLRDGPAKLKLGKQKVETTLTDHRPRSRTPLKGWIALYI
jgi:hypothetical protein